MKEAGYKLLVTRTRMHSHPHPNPFPRCYNCRPWARNQLQEAGYKLLGNIGDQFSDLAGEHSAQYSFKLPNVWYFIL